MGEDARGSSRPAPHGVEMRQAPFFVLVLVIALSLRLASGLRTQETFWSTGDIQYDLIATSLADGSGFYTDNVEGLDPRLTGIRERFASFRPPLYPSVLAATYLLAGRHSLPTILLQALLSALVPLLVWAIGRRLFDETVARISACVAAVYPYSVHHDVHLFDTALFEVLLASLVALLLAVRERQSWLGSAAAGVVVGLAIQTRAFFAAFPVALLPWFLLTFRGRRRWALGSWAVVMLCCALTLLPWVLRNYRIHGTLVATTTYGGWNFYLGNNEWALAAARRGEEVDVVLVGALNRSRVNLAGLSETELDRWFYRRGLDFAVSNPGTFIRLLARKLWLLWTPVLNPPQDNPYAMPVHLLSYGPILLLAAVGAVASRARWCRLSLVYFLFAYFSVVYSVYLAMSRYRKPLDAYLIILAVVGARFIWQRAAPRGLTRQGVAGG